MRRIWKRYIYLDIYTNENTIGITQGPLDQGGLRPWWGCSHNHICPPPPPHPPHRLLLMFNTSQWSCLYCFLDFLPTCFLFWCMHILSLKQLQNLLQFHIYMHIPDNSIKHRIRAKVRTQTKVYGIIREFSPFF